MPLSPGQRKQYQLLAESDRAIAERYAAECLSHLPDYSKHKQVENEDLLKVCEYELCDNIMYAEQYSCLNHFKNQNCCSRRCAALNRSNRKKLKEQAEK